MSEEESEFPVRQEPEAIRGRHYAIVAIASLAIIAASLGAVVLLMRGAQPEPGAVVVPPRRPEPVAGIEQSNIDSARAQSLERDKRERLQSWGWVDADAGIAHIPIDEAMRWVADDAANGRLRGAATQSGAEPSPDVPARRAASGRADGGR